MTTPNVYDFAHFRKAAKQNIEAQVDRNALYEFQLKQQAFDNVRNVICIRLRGLEHLTDKETALRIGREALEQFERE